MMNSTSTRKSVRINFVVPPRTRLVLESIRDRTDAKSMTQVLERAIALYDAVTDELKRGAGEVLTRDQDGHETKIRIV